MIGESRITQFYTYFLRCVFDSLEKTSRINTRFNCRVGSQTPAMSNKTGAYRMVLVLAELLECLQMLAFGALLVLAELLECFIIQ
jgi:hypothetical protein